MNIKFYMSDVVGPGLIRGDIPAKYINRIGSEFRVDCKAEIMESDFFNTQIMVFQRGENGGQLSRLMRAKRQGIKTVYDIDDDLFTVPECLGIIHEKYARKEVRDAMLAMMKASDAIIASSEDMADLCVKRAPGVPVFILPNYTDFELSEKAYWGAKPHDDVVIGWHGSHSHVGDVPLVRDAVCEIMARYPNVRLKLMGCITPEHFGEKIKPYADRVTGIPWVYYYHLPYELAACDIGLCPMTDIQFNRVRSTVKLQEYAAAGVAVVASPLPCYTEIIRNGENGMIAERESTDSWIAALSKLVEDETYRRSMATAARKEAMARFDIRDGVFAYMEVYRKIMQIP